MQRFINHWQTALSVALPAGAEQMQIPAAAAGLLSFEDGAWFKLTVTNAARNAWEIVTATAVTDGALAIVRGQEGTADTEWPTGSLVFVELTAQAMNDVVQQISTLAAGQLEQDQRIAGLVSRLEALEQGGPGPGGRGLVDQAGNVLVDQNGNVLVGLGGA